MNISQTAHDKVKLSWLVLKFTYGLLFIVAGADKFFNIITHWEKYISPMVLNIIPVTSQQFIWGVGIFEIVLGLAILTVATRIGAYIAMAWLLIIAVNLVTMGLYDIAVRDIVMAIGSLVLAFLTDAHDKRV